MDWAEIFIEAIGKIKHSKWHGRPAHVLTGEMPVPRVGYGRISTASRAWNTVKANLQPHGCRIRLPKQKPVRGVLHGATSRYDPMLGLRPKARSATSPHLKTMEC